jgi:predicted metal-binding membrane protein
MGEADIRNTVSIRERAVIWTGLGLITLLAWIYLIRMSNMSGAAMPGMDMAMPMAHRWTLTDMWLMFVMWAVMMVAMMLPGTIPMLTMYAAIVRSKGIGGGANLWVFAAGYVVVWTLFSALATLLQTALQNVSLVSDEMRATPLLGGLILIVAGLYQFTPFKSTCLSHCRSPIGFFMSEWREGIIGAIIMGIRHGAYCAGCCWPLMLLLFVAGVMNLLWVAAISALVLVEKVSRYGKPVATAAGAVLVGSGLLLAVFG